MISSSDHAALVGMLDYLQNVPYDVSRQALYASAELYNGYDPDDEDSFARCYDDRVYKHYISTGKNANSVQESLARTLHDHGINTGLNAFIERYDSRRYVGIMGGHALQRTEPMYKEIVLISKRLTEHGFYMISGGGPGAMEATHLGAWMEGRCEADVSDALTMLEGAPTFKDKDWLASAFRVMKHYPQDKFVSLGIPTWLYGHEPSTPFATHIAKFFENSIREDTILTIAYGGIIYTPGSAGTMQEIFQDAVQNHYLSFGFSSPMIFMGKEFWTQKMPIYPLLEKLTQTGMYKNLQLTLTDDSDEILQQLLLFRERIEALDEKK